METLNSNPALVICWERADGLKVIQMWTNRLLVLFRYAWKLEPCKMTDWGGEGLEWAHPHICTSCTSTCYHAPQCSQRWIPSLNPPYTETLCNELHYRWEWKSLCAIRQINLTTQIFPGYEFDQSNTAFCFLKLKHLLHCCFEYSQYDALPAGNN